MADNGKAFQTTDNGKYFLTTVQTGPGDSGGPLFDLAGSLVGIHSGPQLPGGNFGRYVPSDALLQVWKDLAGDRAVPRSSAVRPAVEETLAAATAQGVRAVQPSVAEIRCDDRNWSGIGAYLGEGFLVTRAGEHVLGRKVTVVLGDNYVTGARVVATDPARDLALLKLNPKDAEGIAPIKWADVNDLPAGTILAAVMPPAFTPPSGVVSVPARKINAIHGSLPVEVKDAKGGVEITSILQVKNLPHHWLGAPPFPLRQGDVITHVAGVPVPDREAFVKLVRPAHDKGTSIGRHPLVAGELVTVTYQRQGKKEEVTVHLRPSGGIAVNQLFFPTSYRWSGYPAAIAADLFARPEHCGAPVVDTQGRVVGLLIARVTDVASFILPASEVKASVEAMRKSATAQ
jgi:S1-C subfamily serine protease